MYGRAVCANCFFSGEWLCADCNSRFESASEYDLSRLRVASRLLFCAFLLIFLGMIIMSIGIGWNIGNVNEGAVVFIGPVPIIIGSGPHFSAANSCNYADYTNNRLLCHYRKKAALAADFLGGNILAGRGCSYDFAYWMIALSYGTVGEVLDLRFVISVHNIARHRYYSTSNGNVSM